MGLQNSLEYIFTVTPPGSYRSVILYCQKDTDDVLIKSVLSLVSTSDRYSSWVTINIDLIDKNFNRMSKGYEDEIFNIFLFDSLDDFERIPELEQLDVWTSQGKHLLMIPDNPNDDSKLTESMKVLWKCKMLNSVIFFWNNELTGYTFNPYKDDFNILLFEVKDNYLICYEPTIFTDKTINVYQENFTIYLYQNPPKVLWLPNRMIQTSRFSFGGRDGYATTTIFELLNGSLNYISAPVEPIVTFQRTKSRPGVLLRNYYGRIIDADDITPSNYQAIDGDNITAINSADLIMMSRLVVVKNPAFDFLYPHEFDCVSVIIPNVFITPYTFDGVFKDISIKLVPVALLIYVIVWKLFGFTLRKKYNSFSLVSIRLLGLYLGTSPNYKTVVISERVLLISLFFFSQTTIVVISALLYENFLVGNTVRNFNTIEELTNSDFKILINVENSIQMDEWGSHLQ